MDEFAFIELITERLGARRNALGGVGDDAAILDVPADQQLVVTSDTLVSGVHFFEDAHPADIAYKSLAVNLSDLAAMGARPAWFFLAVTVPTLDVDWASDFAEGLRDAAAPAGIALAGGDTTRGPLSITITACGLVEKHSALLRNGARVGDLIGLTGTTGLAGMALRDRLAGRVAAERCGQALDRPIARLELGQALSGLANSAIDISDGLLADVMHIATASGVRACIFPEQLPCPEELQQLENRERWTLQLTAGDDYELCFTAPPDHWERIQAIAQSVEVPVTRIGEVTDGSGVECLLEDGSSLNVDRIGYNHGSGTLA